MFPKVDKTYQHHLVFLFVQKQTFLNDNNLHHHQGIKHHLCGELYLIKLLQNQFKAKELPSHQLIEDI